MHWYMLANAEALILYEQLGNDILKGSYRDRFFTTVLWMNTIWRVCESVASSINACVSPVGVERVRTGINSLQYLSN